MRFACVFFVVVRVPPRSPLTDTLFPYTALVRSPPRKGGRFRVGAFAPRGQEGRPFSFGGLRPPGPGRAAVFLWGPSPPGSGRAAVFVSGPLLLPERLDGVGAAPYVPRHSGQGDFTGSRPSQSVNDVGRVADRKSTRLNSSH